MEKKVNTLLPQKEELRLLDLATGTADQVIMLCDINPNIGSATGMDLSDEMLNIGREKIKRFNGKIELHNGDAVQLPIKDAEYDALTMSFGIRNVPDVPASMREMYRVLGEGGKSIDLRVLFAKESNRSDSDTCFIYAMFYHWLVDSSPVIMRLINISTRVSKHFHMEKTSAI